jgi:lipoprotein-releasing system ATP-binding protein
MSESVVSARHLARTYNEGASAVTVLQDINLELASGDLVAVVGASGSGKSTLLNLLGGLDRPSEGQVTICGADLVAMNEKQRCQFRNRHLGFIYQFHHLLPEFSALENVAMPLLIRGDSPADARAEAAGLLEQVGLAARTTHKPGELSGGERQRVAIARALVTKPDLVLADEPTGNLDERTAGQVQALMLDLNQRLGTAFLVVTHDGAFAERCQRVLSLHDGRLASD